MSANLITGNLFKPIYAYQDADYQAGISGNVTSIMPVGSQMALSIEDANTIKADDGVLITKEGRRIQIDAGAIEEWSIPTGTQGATNYFIIGFHLYTDSNSAEVCETFVEKMENATDTIPEGTFREGSTEVYVSLGRVIQNGINLDSVTSLVQIAQSFEDVKNAITQLNSDLGSKSSASAVIGNDAFSKIATLNSDLSNINALETITSWDNADRTKVGFYYCSGTAPTNYTVGVSIPQTSHGDYGVQICVSFAGTTGKFYSRSWTTGITWGTWREYPTLSEAVTEATKVTALGVTSWESMVTSVQSISFLQSGKVKILHLAILGNFTVGTYNIGKLASSPTYGPAYFPTKCGDGFSTACGHGTISVDGTITVNVTKSCGIIVLQAVFI